jgi:hypothetical protein
VQLVNVLRQVLSATLSNLILKMIKHFSEGYFSYYLILYHEGHRLRRREIATSNEIKLSKFFTLPWVLVRYI